MAIKKKISWKALEHHAGAAVKVPALVDMLSSAGDSWKYCAELESAFVQEGQSCTAAGPTIGLLLDHLAEAANPEWILRVVANIAGSDQLWAWLRDPSGVDEHVGAILFERRADLFSALKRDTPAVRSAAAFVLGVAPSALVPEAVEHLKERLSTDSSEHVLASCLLALARLSSDDTRATVPRLAAHQSALVRGAAAVAVLRADPKLDLVALLPGLADWLGSNQAPSIAPPEFWWWSRSPRFSYLEGFFHARLQNAAMLVEMSKYAQRIGAWTDAMLDLPKHAEPGWSYRGATDFLAIAYGFAEKDKSTVSKPDQLSDAQQALAHRLADSPLFVTAGYGLPASGPVRRRWLGLDPPGLMERLVEFEGRSEPLYWVWRSQTIGSPPLPQVENLPGFDRWRVYVSDMTGEYVEGFRSPDPKAIHASVTAAAADPAIKNAGPAILNEFAARVSEWRRQHGEGKYTPETAALILLPFLKAGFTWDSAWEPLLPPNGDLSLLVQDFVPALPTEQREAWLWANPQKLKTELTYVEQLPSARLVKRTLLKLAQFRREGTTVQPPSLELERKIHELAATKPHFAEALKEARAEGYEG